MQRDGSVVVALATFRRPDLLRKCLDSFRAQTFPNDQFEICVVDNDPDQSAREVVDAFRRDFDGRVSYLHEPTPGIPAARNVATTFAADRGADWIAFIDDDEHASPIWLEALLKTAQEYDADGVQGPVLPDFEAGGPAQIAELGMHDQGIAPRGTRLSQARTGNLLLNMRRLSDVAGSCPFDLALGETGGSDSELTMRLTRSGATIVTEPSAVVHEFVPLERQSLEWMTRRAMRTSSTWVAFQRRHNSGFRFWIRRARALNRWVARTMFYRARHLVSRSELDRMRAAVCAARARGQIMGMRGRMVNEYARADSGEH